MSQRIVVSKNPSKEEIQNVLFAFSKFRYGETFKIEDELLDSYIISIEKNNPRHYNDSKITNFIEHRKQSRKLFIGFPINVNFENIFPEEYEIFVKRFPLIESFIEDNKITNVTIVIGKTFSFNRYTISERTQKEIVTDVDYLYDFFKKISDKIFKNQELSTLVFSSLILMFHKIEETDEISDFKMNLDINEFPPGFRKYVDHEITLTDLLQSNCFNQDNIVDEYISINNKRISFIGNTVLKCGNPKIYLDYPEIRYLECLYKYFSRINSVK